MTSDSTTLISRSANRFLTGTMLSRVTGMLRDMSMAWAFGTSAHVAAFLMALRFAHLFRRVFGEGAMQSAFVPLFEECRQEDPREACLFFCNLSTSLSIVITILATACALGIAGILAFYPISENNREILLLTAIMLPSLLFICLFGVNATLLQCEKSFFTPSIAPVAFNLIWIAGALSLRSFEAKTAMPYLAACVIIACLGQWLVTLPKTGSYCYRMMGDAFWKEIVLFSKKVKKIAKPLSLGVIGVAATQINSALDVIFARVADPQGPAYLWYAVRLHQLPIGLFGVSLAGALLPPLSRAIKQNNLEDYQRFLRYATLRNLAIMIPSSAALVLLSAPGINLVFGHGYFNAESTLGTCWCLWGYSTGLLPMTLVMIFAPAYYAKGNYRLPAIASVISVFCNIALNYSLVVTQGLGPASVALATGISSWINLFILTGGLAKEVGWAPFLQPFKQVRHLFLMTLSAFIIAAVISTIYYGWATFPLISGIGLPVFPKEITEQMAFFLIPAATFLIVLLLTINKDEITTAPK